MSYMNELIDIAREHGKEGLTSTPDILDWAREFMRANIADPKKRDSVMRVNMIINHLSEPSKEYLSRSDEKDPSSLASEPSKPMSLIEQKAKIAADKKQQGQEVMEEEGMTQKKKVKPIDEDEIKKWARRK